jgi:hypothetical protein
MTKTKLALLAAVATLSLTNPAAAQFYQKGPKLVGTGAVGSAFEGAAVSLSADGNTAILGGFGDNGGAGAAWIYTRSNATWAQQAKLIAADAIGNARQGFSVSLSGDGNIAIVGGYVDNDFVGAAWVYTRSGGVWSEQAKLVGTDLAGVGDQGFSVAVSSDGNTIISGAAGAAWVFTRSGTEWIQQAKLTVTDPAGFVDLGYSAALSDDGNTAIVGGPVGDVGAAWVFTRSGGVWSEQAKLVGTGAVGNAAQGFSVALSGDGNTAVVGGNNDDSLIGASWVFTRSTSGAWSQQGAKLVGTPAFGEGRQGNSVSISGDGNSVIVGGYLDNNAVGAAWVFTRSGAAWNQRAKLVGTGAAGNAQQGFSVAFSSDGDTAIVGGPYDNNTVGAAWVFAPFAGTPGIANCYGKSVSALAQQYGGLNNAAAKLGYPSVPALQNAIEAYCEA